MYDVSVAGEGVVASRFMRPREDNRWVVVCGCTTRKRVVVPAVRPMLIKERVRRCEI
jgi:hypothetical protein